MHEVHPSPSTKEPPTPCVCIVGWKPNAKPSAQTVYSPGANSENRYDPSSLDTTVSNIKPEQSIKLTCIPDSPGSELLRNPSPSKSCQISFPIVE